MSARWLAVAGLVLASPASAQDASPQQLADQFEYALVAGDARPLPLADGFRYSENGSVLKPWDGMWRTLSAVSGTSAALYPRAAGLDYRLEVAEGDEIVRLFESDENTVQGVTALRLKLADGKIARADVLPVREEFSGARGGTLTLLQPSLPVTLEGAKVPAADPLFNTPVSRLATRKALTDLANAYFDGMLTNSAAKVTFAPDCLRRDNGQAVTGVADAPLLDPAKPYFRPFALGCGVQLESGYYSNIRQIRGRTFWVDHARGVVLAQVQMDQPGTALSFVAPGHGTINYPGPRGVVQTGGQQFEGRILNNMISPLTMSAMFAFKIDDGRIRRIDAFYRGAPYGWQLSW